jgi:hypothetical protein
VSAARAAEALARAGLNVTGALAIASYDALVPAAWRSAALAPGAGGALVVGNGGRVLWDAFARAPERALAENPLDAYTRRALADAARECTPAAAVGFYADKRDGAYLPLVALAQRAGFGTPGRIGVLIHPEFGPWLAIRGVLLVAEPLVERPVAPFAPCVGCPAPCATACRGAVVGLHGLDAAGCYQTRLTNPGCASACDARSACVVGPEHAYSREQLAHHMRIPGR